MMVETIYLIVLSIASTFCVWSMITFYLYHRKFEEHNKEIMRIKHEMEKLYSQQMTEKKIKNLSQPKIGTKIDE